MKKHLIDFEVTACTRHDNGYVDMLLKPLANEMPEIEAGQFVNIRTGGGVMLRRPISVNDVDYQSGLLRLLVKNLGRGTDALYRSRIGDIYNILLPLGHGFDLGDCRRPLLCGGGVGTAPMLYAGRVLAHRGIKPEFLLAAKTKDELVQIDDFEKYGHVHVATDDGSLGHKGFAASHPCLTEGDYDLICVCGPEIMMRTVAAVARQRGIDCQVSLENKMACGLGACLCCVEDTKEGNRCTCTDGPVFNLNELKW